jgi:hypothetical protein
MLIVVLLQLHHNIIKSLPTNKDVLNYGLLCKRIQTVINDSVWRARFVTTFDDVKTLNVSQRAETYKERCKVKAVLTSFEMSRFNLKYDQQGAHEREQLGRRTAVLQMLKSLILGTSAILLYKLAADFRRIQCVQSY